MDILPPLAFDDDIRMMRVVARNIYEGQGFHPNELACIRWFESHGYTMGEELEDVYEAELEDYQDRAEADRTMRNLLRHSNVPLRGWRPDPAYIYGLSRGGTLVESVRFDNPVTVQHGDELRLQYTITDGMLRTTGVQLVDPLRNRMMVHGTWVDDQYLELPDM